MAGYLIYHPKREKTVLDQTVVYHDSLTGNQDPYVWNTRFLHTFCHMTQMSPAEGEYNFWVTGDTFPEFSELFCDLVFVVQEKIFWTTPNKISSIDPIVESKEAFNDHYRWANSQHPLKRRRRFTLKANPQLSFQPQNAHGKLIDIVPSLVKAGVSLEELRVGLRLNFASRPMPINDKVSTLLYESISDSATLKLRGDHLSKLRRHHSELGNP